MATMSRGSSTIVVPWPTPAVSTGSNNTIVSNSLVTISGKAIPGSKVEVTIGSASATTTADNQGNWQVVIAKDPGTYAAEVKFTAPDGSTTTKNFTVKVLGYSAGSIIAGSNFWLLALLALILALVGYFSVRKGMKQMRK
jgi:phosphatidate phosphatase APP1